MGKPIRQLIPAIQEKLVNFSFLDFAAGTGYATYYGGKVRTSYALSNNVFNSDNLNTSAVIVSSAAYTKLIDLDFDVNFNIPQNIKGPAIVDVPVGIYNLGTGTTGEAYIEARIRKWNGTAETSLAVASSAVWAFGTLAGQMNYNMRSAKPVIPSTHFQAGETLRLTIEGWAKLTEANDARLVLYHDPANRSSCDGELYNNPLASGASILKLQLPIKIEG